MKEGSQFYLREDEQCAVVGYVCESMCSCVMLHLRRYEPCFDQFTVWVESRLEPRCWYWKNRWKMLWRILRGQPLDINLELNWATVEALSKWLARGPEIKEPYPTREERMQNLQDFYAWVKAGKPLPPVAGDTQPKEAD